MESYRFLASSYAVSAAWSLVYKPESFVFSSSRMGWNFRFSLARSRFVWQTFSNNLLFFHIKHIIWYIVFTWWCNSEGGYFPESLCCCRLCKFGDSNTNSFILSSLSSIAWSSDWLIPLNLSILKIHFWTDFCFVSEKSQWKILCHEFYFI